MANPRKFSEKIALHNQKQAEETAAFEAIMRDVSEATRNQNNAGYVNKSQGLHLSPTLSTYRGGSLPNVNQIGNNTVDLQNALHTLNDMKHGRESLVDRFRERARQIPGHGRQQRTFPFDKRIDCSPYGATYLSPPPDTSWRRTNSDSALHTSAMTPQMDPMLQSPTTPPTHRRVAQLSGSGENQLQTTDPSQLWDPKKHNQLENSRPRSCEVPGINIYPSPEQDSGVHIPIANNTGSLPDLTNLHFPSPLATPLDAEDQNYTQGGSPLSLSPTNTQGPMVGMQTSPSLRRRHHQGPPSPLIIHSSPTQLRHTIAPQGQLDSTMSGQPSYHPYSTKPTSLHHQAILNYHRKSPKSQTNSLSPPGIPSQSDSNFPMLGANTNLNGMAAVGHQTSPNSTEDMAQSDLLLMCLQNQNPNIRLTVTDPNDKTVPVKIENGVTVGQTLPSAHGNMSSQAHTMHNDKNKGTSMTQYRNSQSDNACQSPTSPLSQPSYSPSQSPGLPPTTTVSSSTFGDPYWQQQTQQQTTALQHQFEQFNMLQSENQANQPTVNGSVSLPLYGGQMNLQLSQAHMAGLMGSQEFQQQQPQQQSRYYPQQGDLQTTPQQQSPQQGSPQPPQSPQNVGSPATVQISPGPDQTHAPLTPQNSNKIPDIILTGGSEGSWVPILQGTPNQGYGADDLIQRQNMNFAKDLGTAMAGMPDSFDSDFFTADEALKVGLDPLDLEMLTDPNLVTDPANEDAFRLDRL